MPRNITITFEDGSSHVYQNAPDEVTPEQVTARAEQEFQKRVSALDGGKERKQTTKDILEETGRVADKTLRGGALALPSMMGELGLAVGRNVNKPGNPLMGTPAGAVFRLAAPFTKNLPPDETKFGDVTKTIQTAGGLLPPVSEPKTSAGKAVGNVGEAVVGTVLGGGAGTVGQKAVIGAGAGGGGELAARLFGDNALTRLIGAFLGGGAVGGVQATVSNKDKLVRQATEHVTDADFLRAQQREQLLVAQGIPHTKSQLLGPRSTLDDVVATASANPSVRPGLVTATEGAPGKAQEALNVWTNRNLPPPGPASRQEVLSDVQEAANNVLRTIKERSNQAFTKTMPPKGIEYDQGRVKTLYNSLRQLADDPRFGDTSDAGKALMKFADRLVDSREWDLSKVHPVLLRKAQQAAKDANVAFDPSTVPGARQVTTFVTNAHKINNLNKEAKLMSASEDFKGLPVEDIRRIMNLATPEFNRARAAKSVILRDQYEPTSRGLTGQLAQIGGGVKPDKTTVNDRALAIIFNPDMPQAQAIRDLGQNLGGHQVGELLREHIQKSMQRVLKADDKSPRSFVLSLYESPAQKENIEAALEVVARANRMNPDAVKHGFRRLMDALDSFKDLKLAEGVSPATTAAQAGRNPVSQVATPLTGIRRFAEARVTASTYRKIAELVTSPDGLKKIQAIARTPNQETVRQVALGMVLSASQGLEPEGKE